MNLKKLFLEYCLEKKFEINQGQLGVINNLKDYYITRGIYDKFLIIKQKYDPDNIFNPINNFSTL